MRLRVVIRGAVQGVGFRPFIYRLATELALKGWVVNSSQGVFVEVEGDPASLDAFLLRIEPEKPPHAFIQSLESSYLDPIGFDGFEIRHSDEAGAKTALVLPDLATCPDCLREIFDLANRRYLYPFTNCTHCGPRFTIIEGLPYDRPNTTMKAFVMCDACRAEYEDPLDRRFHAQPNACPQCGPHLELWDADGRPAGSHGDAPLHGAADAIRRGLVVAVKGLGGFHLMVDARDDDAVQRLRLRKRREEKPFALMYPSLALIEAHCEIGDLEARLLRSSEAPIVLVRKRQEVGRRRSEDGGQSPHDHGCLVTLPPSHLVAPAPNPYLGVMLPYTPLHHILMAELGFPVVATSGNLSDEPICIDEREALDRLRGIADVFLVHNRPIVRHADDSIARIMGGREMLVRRARGYAPLPVALPTSAPRVLAVGAHLKNAVAVSIGNNIFISQHIGDLETAQAYDAFRRVIDSLSGLYEFQPDAVACDLHPDYLATQFAEAYAEQRGVPLIKVQHHFAHVAACRAENGLEGRVLGVAWDGTGYGLDGTVWGGEFLLTDEAGGVDEAGVGAPARRGFSRFAHLRPFRLPGGDQAIKEPRRVALGVLHELFGASAFDMTDLAPVAALSPAERSLFRRMLQQRVNAPVTTSAGRLFDAVAALAGLHQRLNYEGQAAMDLEFAIGDLTTDEAYPFEIGAISHPQSPISIDWSPLIRAVIDDARRGAGASAISGRFHNALAEIIVGVAKRAGEERVVLTGGCFQNKVLLERAILRLRAEGFRPYWHQRVPPNDGGIALGQAAAAAALHVF